MKTHLQLAQRYFFEGVREHTIPHNKHHILLACMPKSGSTYLATIFSNTGDFRSVNLGFQGTRREQEVDREALILNNRYNYVAQLHVRYHHPLSELMERYNVLPVVLIRDIFDVIVSLHDHLMKHDDIQFFPMAYLDLEMRKWDEEKLLMFIVQMFVPWYLNFFLSWETCPNKIQINFSDVTTNPNGTLKTIYQYLGIKVTDGDVAKAIDKAGNLSTRKNVGIVGRGKNLPQSVRDAVYTLTEYYADHDLSPIGLSRQ